MLLFSHTLLNMEKEGKLEPMIKKIFVSTFQKLNIKNSDEIIQELAKIFRNKSKKIDVALMLKKYLELYPSTTI